MSSADSLSKGPASGRKYEPRYVNIDDIPIRASEDAFAADADAMANGLDGYDDPTKRLALREAEAQLEDDVNGGAEIDLDPLPHNYWAAARNLATFVLYNPAIDPRYGINMSSVEEYGAERSSYVDKYRERYESLVASINSTAGTGEGGDDDPQTDFWYVDQPR